MTLKAFGLATRSRATWREPRRRDLLFQLVDFAYTLPETKFYDASVCTGIVCPPEALDSVGVCREIWQFSNSCAESQTL